MESTRLNHLPLQKLSQISPHQQPQNQGKSLSPKHHSIHLNDSTASQPPRLIKTVMSSDAKKSSPDFPQDNEGPRKNAPESSNDDNQIDRPAEASGSRKNQLLSGDLPSTSTSSSSQDFSSSSHREPLQYISYPYMPGLYMDPSYMRLMNSGDSYHRQQYQKMLEQEKRFPLFPWPLRYSRK